MGRKYEPLFGLTEKIIIDGCAEMPAVITAVSFRMTGVKYEVNWWNNGDLKEAWVDEWRLSKWEE